VSAVSSRAIPSAHRLLSHSTTVAAFDPIRFGTVLASGIFQPMRR
jgi:hypothetical protein